MARLLKNIFVHNLALKLIALLAAALLWLYVITEKEYSFNYNFALETYGLSKKYSLKYPLPDSITVNLAGKGRQLLKLHFEDLRAVIDASTFTTGVHIVKLTDDNFIIPVDDIVLQEIVEPTSVEIALDFLDKKEVPIENRLVVVPDDGYVVDGRITFEPPTVILGGPDAELRKVDRLYTKADTVRGVKITTTLLTELDTTGLTVVPVTRKVIATIPIDDISSKSFNDIPVSLKNAPAGFRGTVQPRTIDLTLAGASSGLEALSKGDIEVHIDYKQLALEGSKIRPIIKLPPYIRVASKSPEYFMIEEK